MKEKKQKEVAKETTTKEQEQKKEPVKLREIIIETDGNNIKIKKAEVGGKIELLGILQSLINFINEQK